MNLTIDGRLVVTADRGSRQLYVFHEYGSWSVLAVATSSDPERTAFADGTASVVLEQVTSLAEVATAIDRHGGPGTWRQLIDEHDDLRSRRAVWRWRSARPWAGRPCGHTARRRPDPASSSSTGSSSR
jgi:hypothetical protein